MCQMAQECRGAVCGGRGWLVWAGPRPGSPIGVWEDEQWACRRFSLTPTLSRWERGKSGYCPASGCVETMEVRRWRGCALLSSLNPLLREAFA